MPIGSNNWDVETYRNNLEKSIASLPSFFFSYSTYNAEFFHCSLKLKEILNVPSFEKAYIFSVKTCRVKSLKTFYAY